MSTALARRLGLASKPSVWSNDAGDWHTLCDHSPNGIRWLYAGPSWRSALDAAAAHCHEQEVREQQEVRARVARRADLWREWVERLNAAVR